MKLKDIQLLLKRYENDFTKMNNDIVIGLDEPSIGYSAHEHIDEISSGIDWDNGMFIIYPSKKLIHKEKNRDVPVFLAKDPCFPRRFICSACGGFVSKDDNYCRSCGQKLKGVKNE